MYYDIIFTIMENIIKQTIFSNFTLLEEYIFIAKINIITVLRGNK